MNDTNVTTQTDVKTESRLNDTAGKWLGWVGIVVGVVGFFWLRVWLGAIAAILGVIGLFSPQKKLSWVAIAAGVVAIILGIVL